MPLLAVILPPPKAPRSLSRQTLLLTRVAMPVGLECTIVAVGIKDTKLHASFTDITITANQTVNVSLAETSEADFKSKLTALNNN